MKIFRILLHSFILNILNLSSIWVGFVIWYSFFRPANQIRVQVPLAVLVCLIAFLVWSFTVYRLPFKNLSLHARDEFAGTFFLSLMWFPVVFVPLHYITQGYLTSFGNIVGGWKFQIPTNLFILIILAACKWRAFDNEVAKSIPT